MSQWRFHSSWKQAELHKATNPNKMSGCSVHSNRDHPFAPRPKIARTPIVLGTNLNDENINRNMLGQSPAMSYFIPNTPCYRYKPPLQQAQGTPVLKEVPEEPGSSRSTGVIHTKARKKRRRSSTTSQPEGTYSPIPRSKFLSELNESFNRSTNPRRYAAQSPVSLVEKGDEKSESPPANLVSSEMKRKIRSEVLAEIEEMEHQIKKEMDAEYLLLNPSPSSLLSQMSKLQITQDATLTPLKPLNMHSVACVGDDGMYVSTQSQWNWKQFVMRYCCNKDIFCNLLNFVWIIIVLTLYWNLVDFHWA